MSEKQDICEAIALLEIEVQTMFLRAKSPHSSIRALAASDRSAPHMLLSALSKDTSIEVRRALLENHMCPGFIVGELVDCMMDEFEHPFEASMRDPSAELILLAVSHPNIPAKSAISIIEDFALEDSDFRDQLEELIFSNPGSTTEVLYRMVAFEGINNRDIFNRAESHQNFIRKDFDDAMMRHFESNDIFSFASEFIAKSSLSSENLLVQLYEELMADQSPKAGDLLLDIANNTSTPPALLQKLCQLVADRWPYVESCEKIVSASRYNKNHPAHLKFLGSKGLQKAMDLAKSDVESLRLSLAFNPSTPSSVLAELAKDKRAIVRSAVAENPSCPAQTLKDLACDFEGVVRINVARNKNCPLGVLDGFLQSQFHEYREAVASSSETPSVLLRLLAEDADGQVSKAARGEIRRRSRSSANA
jgi:hypothetical protein